MILVLSNSRLKGVQTIRALKSTHSSLLNSHKLLQVTQSNQHKMDNHNNNSNNNSQKFLLYVASTKEFY